MSDPKFAPPDPPVMPKCTCWIGRGDKGGWAPDRMTCAVHGDTALTADLNAIRKADPPVVSANSLRALLNDAGAVLAFVEYRAEARTCPECNGSPHMPVCRLRDVLSRIVEELEGGAAPVVGIAHQEEQDRNESRVDGSAHVPAAGTKGSTSTGNPSK